ncbi:MAG TPA: glycosyltransferase [Pyrinomonadaceae bacterium]|jgi:glycosyltransferase involved in cell wall biosynthesis
MRVLSVCSYPNDSATTRYRLTQFVEPLARRGIDLEISSFFDDEQFRQFYKNKSLFKAMTEMSTPVLRRVAQIRKARGYDVLLVQREAMNFGPAVFEWIFQKFGGLPMLLDLDDATYIPYTSPTFGKIGSFFKFFGKTDKLIERADVVICGNRFIAEYVEKKGTEAVIIPTVVDTSEFKPIEKNNAIPIVGWIGTHSTFPLLQSIFPVLQKLAEKHRFTLKIVGSGREHVEIEGVTIENLAWNLERETADFQSLDIGVYPITVSSTHSDEWLLGKSGFKAIQYLAVGIPFVMTPVGVCGEIGEPGATHFNALSDEDWYNALDKLLDDENLRKQMGKAGRMVSLRDYTIEMQFEKLEDTLRRVYRNRRVSSAEAS